jgi:hypothetical protein
MAIVYATHSLAGKQVTVTSCTDCNGGSFLGSFDEPIQAYQMAIQHQCDMPRARLRRKQPGQGDAHIEVTLPSHNIISLTPMQARSLASTLGTALFSLESEVSDLQTHHNLRELQKIGVSGRTQP